MNPISFMIFVHTVDHLLFVLSIIERTGKGNGHDFVIPGGVSGYSRKVSYIIYYFYCLFDWPRLLFCFLS
jgi:hypothetical protein